MALGDFRSAYFPYCIDRQEDGRYAVLNREYKPVGFSARQWVVYEDYPVLVKLKGLTKAKAVRISFDGSDDLDRIYLYNDGCVPTASKADMSAYFDRLSVLAKLKLE